MATKCCFQSFRDCEFRPGIPPCSQVGLAGRTITAATITTGTLTISHTATIEAEFKDPLALAAACRRLGLEQPVLGEHVLYESSMRHRGHAVKLPGWSYPVICDLTAKKVYMDNFNGHWGDIAEFNKLKQAYATEAAIAVARRQGFRVQEQRQPNGAIKLVLAK